MSAKTAIISLWCFYTILMNARILYLGKGKEMLPKTVTDQVWIRIGKIQINNNTYWAMFDCYGYLVLQEDMASIVKDVLPFYSVITQEDVCKHNDKISSQRQKMAFLKQQEQERIERRLNTDYGFVYLLFLSCSGHHKIGHSNDPDRRVWKEISPKLPEKPEVVCAIETEDRFALESRLHKKFSGKRTNGEWFKLEPADVEYIKGLANE